MLLALLYNINNKGRKETDPCIVSSRQYPEAPPPPPSGGRIVRLNQILCYKSWHLEEEDCYLSQPLQVLELVLPWSLPAAGILVGEVEVDDSTVEVEVSMLEVEVMASTVEVEVEDSTV